MILNAFYSSFSFPDKFENAVSEHLKCLNAYVSGKIRCSYTENIALFPIYLTLSLFSKTGLE